MSRIRTWLAPLALGLALAAGQPPGIAPARAQPAEPPHTWAFGTWTGGFFPPGDTENPACAGQPSVIITRDVVLRSAPLEVPLRQRLIETAAAEPGRLTIRLAPLVPPGSPLAARLPPGTGFGCKGDPNLLVIERTGPDEITFPDCADFPARLKRCGSP